MSWNIYYNRENRARVKIALFVISLGLLGILFVYKNENSQPLSLPFLFKKNLGKNIHYKGTDSAGRIVTVTARESIKDGEEIKFLKPIIEIKLNSKETLHISAKKGTMKNKIFQFFNKVNISHSSGFLLTSKKISIDLKKRIAKSETPIEGQGDQIHLFSKKMYANEKKITFVDNPKMIIYPS